MICTRHITSSVRMQLLRNIVTFNNKRKILQRNRAANFPNNEQYDYLKDGVAEILADRITDINRDFPTIVDLGCNKGHIYKHLNSYITKELIECDTAAECLSKPRGETEFKISQVLLTDDDELPFTSNSVNLVISNLWLHWVNDIPKLFQEVERVLVPDGVFLGSMFASDCIYQLRVSLQQAEQERTGGIAPHISPFVTPQDLGSLLHSARFCMTTLDVEDFTITYPDLYFLIRDLQGMGESNCLISQPNILRRDVLTGTAAIYKSLYANEDGSLPLTFNVIYFVGWKQSDLQGIPKPRGSQTASFKDMDDIMSGVKPK